MKKLFALTLALILALSLAACGGGTNNGSGGKSGDAKPPANNENDTSQTTAAPPDNGGNRYDYQFKNGVLTALEQTFADVDVTGRDDKSNKVKFVVINGNSYQFAVGTAATGVAQSFITFDAAKDTAAMKTAIQGAEYTIKYFGNVSDDKLNLQ